MKEFLSLLLTLSLLCAGVALAEENVIKPDTPSQNTTVTFDIPEPGDGLHRHHSRQRGICG